MSLLKRRMEMMAQIKEETKQFVLIDNGYYNGTGAVNSFIEDNRMYVCGLIDSGDTQQKSITFGYEIEAYYPNDITRAVARQFNDDGKGGYSYVDYWDMSLSAGGKTVAKMKGRYYAFSVVKGYRDYFFVYDNTNNVYLYKGGRVS